MHSSLVKEALDSSSIGADDESGVALVGHPVCGVSGSSWDLDALQAPTDRISLRELRPGSRFGHYRLIRVLGTGGFGRVWQAHDTVMDRDVAIKLLLPEFSQDEIFRQRLYREARTAGRLNEPHVVPIHQCGEIDGQLFIEMRYIDGMPLDDVLNQQGPMSPARAVAVVSQIAAALDAVHKAGLIHRDVKPANILLSKDDFAWLVDFGLVDAETEARLTTTGTTIGTFGYMSPERFYAEEVDHRADIYALVCVLYECLTGGQPYPMRDFGALINAHLLAPIPRPTQQRPNIPSAFDDVIARGMAKRAADRYATAGDLARAAQRALIPQPIQQQMAPRLQPTRQHCATLQSAQSTASWRPSAVGDAPAHTGRRRRHCVLPNGQVVLE